MAWVVVTVVQAPEASDAVTVVVMVGMLKRLKVENGHSRIINQALLRVAQHYNWDYCEQSCEDKSMKMSCVETIEPPETAV